MCKSPYVKCPSCYTVISDPERKLQNLAEPAPCCGDTGHIRISWPMEDVLMFFEIVRQQDLNETKDRRIAIVFVSTMLELLLENVLWELLSAHTKSLQLAESALDSYQGRERRIKLYNRLSDHSLRDFFIQHEFSSLLNDWEQLAKIRNKIVHGRYFAETTDALDERELIQRITRSCLQAFFVLHNDAVRQLNEQKIDSNE